MEKLEALRRYKQAKSLLEYFKDTEISNFLSQVLENVEAYWINKGEEIEQGFETELELGEFEEIEKLKEKTSVKVALDRFPIVRSLLKTPKYVVSFSDKRMLLLMFVKEKTKLEEMKYDRKLTEITKISIQETKNKKGIKLEIKSLFKKTKFSSKACRVREAKKTREILRENYVDIMPLSNKQDDPLIDEINVVPISIDKMKENGLSVEKYMGEEENVLAKIIKIGKKDIPLKALSLTEQEVIKLTGECSDIEIAKKLNISVENVYVIRTRAIKKAKDYLSKNKLL